MLGNDRPAATALSRSTSLKRMFAGSSKGVFAPVSALDESAPEWLCLRMWSETSCWFWTALSPAVLLCLQTAKCCKRLLAISRAGLAGAITWEDSPSPAGRDGFLPHLLGVSSLQRSVGWRARRRHMRGWISCALAVSFSFPWTLGWWQFCRCKHFRFPPPPQNKWAHFESCV